MSLPLERITARAKKASQDTAEGCRTRAEADLLKAVVMLTANERVRMEQSAAAWQARATMLQHLDDKMAARRITARSRRAAMHAPMFAGYPDIQSESSEDA